MGISVYNPAHRLPASVRPGTSGKSTAGNFLNRMVRRRRLMVRMAACLLLTGMTGSVRAGSDADAEALLKSIREKFQAARTLQADIKLQMILKKPLEYSGQVRARGASWAIDMTRKLGAASPEVQKAVCDGTTLRMEGVKAGSQSAWEPDRYSRQLREWAAVSFAPMYFALMSEDIDQGDDNVPVVSAVKFAGREKLRGADTLVITYAIDCPGVTGMTVKAWIDAGTKLPVQRQITTKPGKYLFETIDSMTLDREIPDSKFTLQPSTSGAPPSVGKGGGELLR